MKIPKAVILAGLATMAAPAEVMPEPAAEAPGEARPAKGIDVLIRELSDERFRVREEATGEIWRLGEAAMPALEEAAASDDPEKAYRARDLLRKIQLHITPETDPSVIALVELYQKAGSLADKAAAFGKMKGRRAWRQMLKLYAAEKDAALRQKLQPAMNGVALRAARERMVAGDMRGAREYLEMAPADTEGLLALASFHRSQGTLAAELNRARNQQGRNAAAWRLALQRVAGDTAAARAEAEMAGETRIAAAMAGLSGDPLPWLRDPRGEDALAAEYAKLAAKRWTGGAVRPADLEPFTKALASRSPSTRILGVSSLYLLGEVGLAEPAFVKARPQMAMGMLDAQERVREALAALGFDPAQPEFEAWVEKRIDALTADDIEDQHGVLMDGEELLRLASFLERRGLTDEAFSAFSGPMKALAAKDENVFTDTLRLLFGGVGSDIGAPETARRIGAEWAAEDEGRWEELLVAAFGDEDQNADWWEWIGELDPAATRLERFDALLALHDYGRDPGKLREKWMTRIWKSLESLPAAQAGDRAALVASLSTIAGDAPSFLKAWTLLPEKIRNSNYWTQHIVYLSMEGRWEEAANIILKQIALFAEAKQEPSAVLHAYAAAALRQAGRGQEAATHDSWVEKLVLADPSLSIQIGAGYAFGADYERSDLWWARAACEADPDSDEFLTAINARLDHLLEKGVWRESAALAEMLARNRAIQGEQFDSPLSLLRDRLRSDVGRALSLLPENRAQAVAILDRCHAMMVTDGSLADYFFPFVRKAGLIKEHDAWFAETWRRIDEVVKQYPESHNTLNTAAWLASRALRKLDEAETMQNKALSVKPRQPAYLDTMAEIQFARGNRQKALEWSRKAVICAPVDDAEREYLLLRRQQERFRSDPLPK